uniref:Pecanex-like protein n=1 Tax=Taenia asiatica TaxID=60517 RepID=A0A0R3W9Z5_TAEAS
KILSKTSCSVNTLLHRQTPTHINHVVKCLIYLSYFSLPTLTTSLSYLAVFGPLYAAASLSLSLAGKFDCFTGDEVSLLNSATRLSVSAHFLLYFHLVSFSTAHISVYKCHICTTTTDAALKFIYFIG